MTTEHAPSDPRDGYTRWIGAWALRHGTGSVPTLKDAFDGGVESALASLSPSSPQGWQPIRDVLERMRKYAADDAFGYVIDNWADEIEAALPPAPAEGRPQPTTDTPGEAQS